MKKEIRLIVLRLLTIPAIAQKSPGKHDKKFRHELAIGFRTIRIPAGDWRNTYLYGIMPEYNIGYLDKLGLSVRLFGWYGRTAEWRYENMPFYIGQIIARRYVYWDIFPVYTFRLYKRHCLSIGAGYTTRKGSESFVEAVYSFDSIVGGYDINDKGVVGELGYTYDIGKRFIAGADIAYRTYDRGDPVITAGVKFGIVLRH